MNGPNSLFVVKATPLQRLIREDSEQKNSDDDLPFALSSQHLPFYHESVVNNVSQERFPSTKAPCNEGILNNSLKSSTHVFESASSVGEESFENLLQFLKSCPSFIMDLKSSAKMCTESTLLPSLISSIDYTQVSVQEKNDPIQSYDRSTLTYSCTDASNYSIVGDPHGLSSRSCPVLNDSTSNRREDETKHSYHYAVRNTRGCIFPISFNILSEKSFQVSTLFQNTTWNQVLQILSDPNTLTSWYEPVIGGVLLVTDDKGGCPKQSKSESGLLSNHNNQLHHREMHDGVWVEAITTRLNPPMTRFGCMYHVVTMIRNSIGCPSSGTIQLFVERSQGHVVFTVGKFHGGITLSHSMYVVKEDDVGGVRLTDTIHIQEGEDSFPGIFGCYAPSLKDFLDQTMSSFKKLGHRLSESLSPESGMDVRNNIKSWGEDLNVPLLQDVY